MSWAVVPVKKLEASKSRLLPELAPDAREALCLAMLSDVLEALMATPSVQGVAVTTPDAAVGEHARSLGAEVILRAEPGLNAALDDAAEKLIGNRDDPYLVVLGDVAGARAAELETLYQALDEGSAAAALAPSADGGTSALLRRPHSAIPSRFGSGSAARHLAAARDAGIPCPVIELPSLDIDLDQPSDLAAFMASEGEGPRTRELLRSLGYAAESQPPAAPASVNPPDRTGGSS